MASCSVVNCATDHPWLLQNIIHGCWAHKVCPRPTLCCHSQGFIFSRYLQGNQSSSCRATVIVDGSHFVHHWKKCVTKEYSSLPSIRDYMKYSSISTGAHTNGTREESIVLNMYQVKECFVLCARSTMRMNHSSLLWNTTPCTRITLQSITTHDSCTAHKLLSKLDLYDIDCLCT